MLVDFEKECERQLLSLDWNFNELYRDFAKIGYTAEDMFRGVCLKTARVAVSEYYEKLQDKAIRKYYGD
mgnify:FL=1|tara:strand:- start:1754 stop:1960 length:207 start_codon:yes stop_codon:yes gene_type:complete